MSFRIVHIEDSELQSLSVKTILENTFKNEDFVYTCATTLSEALCTLDQGCLDVIVVDLSLPDAKGSEAVEAVRNKCPEAPIIVLSGDSELDIAKKCVRAGADNYVTKDCIKVLPLVIIMAVERWELKRDKRITYDRYASIVEESQDWIIRFTPAGLITFANKITQDNFSKIGMPVVGHNLYEFLTASQLSNHRKIINSLSKDNKHVDGNDIWLAGRLIHWRKSGIFDKYGRLIEVQAIGRDLTDQYDLLQQLKKDATKIIGKVTEKSDDMLAKAVDKLKITLTALEGRNNE